MESQLITSAAETISYLCTLSSSSPSSSPLPCVTVKPIHPALKRELAPHFPLSGLRWRAWEVGEPSTSFRPPTSSAGPKGLAPTALPFPKPRATRALEPADGRWPLVAVLDLPRALCACLSNLRWGCAMCEMRVPAGKHRPAGRFGVILQGVRLHLCICTAMQLCMS